MVWLRLFMLKPHMRVVALPEGTWLEVTDNQVVVGGLYPAQLQTANQPAQELALGSRVH